MSENKTRSYNFSVSYSGKFVFTKEEFDELEKGIADKFDKLEARRATRPLTAEETFSYNQCVRLMAMNDDQKIEALLKEAVKDALKEQRKDMKANGVSKLSPPLVVVTPVVPKVSRKCELHDDRKACTEMCKRFLESN